MSESTRMLLGLALGIIVMILLVMKTKVHSFMALLIAAMITGIIGGMPISDVTAVSYTHLYLANPSAYSLGEKVAVIGMGNAAMDVARTALRNGAHQVTMYARGRRIAASSHEMAYAELDGAEFVFGKAIERITEKGPVFKTSIMDENNRVTGYEEGEEQTEADSTIIAISQGPRNRLIRTTVGLEGSDKGLSLIHI